jgi:hypothetical protein
MNDNVFYAMNGLGIEKVEGVIGGWQVAVHAVSHKTLRIVGVGRGLPRVICKPELMADGTELRCGCADHSVVAKAKQRKGYNEAYSNEDCRFDILSHIPSWC